MTTRTILFVDQVESTRQLATLGDRSAGDVRGEMAALVRAHLETYRGEFLRDTGDGFMACFDSAVNARRLRAVAPRGPDGFQREPRAGAPDGAADGAAHR